MHHRIIAFAMQAATPYKKSFFRWCECGWRETKKKSSKNKQQAVATRSHHHHHRCHRRRHRHCRCGRRCLYSLSPSLSFCRCVLIRFFFFLHYYAFCHWKGWLIFVNVFCSYFTNKQKSWRRKQKVIRNERKIFESFSLQFAIRKKSYHFFFLSK